MANSDGLTGLCNRRSMDLRIDAAWDEAVRAGKPFGLLMLDVDNFKKYNDHYGHQAGDDVLRKVAGAISAVIKEANDKNLTHDSFPARYGGEEFAVSIPQASKASFDRIATAIVGAIHQLNIPHEHNADWGVVTISIGGMLLDVANGRLAPMFRTADERLYQAKNNGRNRAVLE